MGDETRRMRRAEDLLRHLAASMKAVQLYTPDHAIVARSTEQLFDTLERAHVEAEDVVVGIVGREVVVDGLPVTGSIGAAETVERLRAIGVERIAFDRGVTEHELREFIRGLVACQANQGSGGNEPLDGLASPSIHVGRLQVQRRSEGGRRSTRPARHDYEAAVAGAQALWEQAQAEGGPDPVMGVALVDGLASALGQNRDAMLALTALCQYDNYTFTHMVNVSVLTMAQARALGIDGTQLRHFGLAGLMHDIGKIRTPAEILTKPDRLTDAEFEVMKKHPVDGAEMLRRRLELPSLVAAVAFEHHLRVDGSGYPGGVVRPELNLATQLCSIADVYDAMRSKRVYQRAFPSDRILTVLQQNDAARFDQRLVRRFSQLMGIYPPGNIVRLDTGALAVVLRTHAPDPARPAVRVVVGPDGRVLRTPVDLALWDDQSPAGPPPRIVSPVDPKEAGIDPLAVLDATAA